MSLNSIIIGVIIVINLRISAKSTDDNDWKNNEPKCKDPMPVAAIAQKYYFNDTDPFDQGCGSLYHGPSSAYSGVHAVWKLCRPNPNPENCGFTPNGMRLTGYYITDRCKYEKFLSRIPIAKSELYFLKRSLVGHAILMQCLPDGIMAAYQTCDKPFGIYKMTNEELEDFREIDSRVPDYRVDWLTGAMSKQINDYIEKCNDGDHDKKTGFQLEEYNSFVSEDAARINSPPKNKPRKPRDDVLSRSWVWNMEGNVWQFCVDPSKFFGRQDFYFKDNITLAESFCEKDDYVHYPGEHAIWRLCRGDVIDDVDCGFKPKQWNPTGGNIHERCNEFIQNGKKKIPRIPLAKFTWNNTKMEMQWERPVIFLQCEYDGIIAAEQTCKTSFGARRMLWDEIGDHQQIGTYERSTYDMHRRCPIERQNFNTGYKHEIFYELKKPLPKYEVAHFEYDYSSQKSLSPSLAPGQESKETSLEALKANWAADEPRCKNVSRHLNYAEKFHSENKDYTIGDPFKYIPDTCGSNEYRPGSMLIWYFCRSISAPADCGLLPKYWTKIGDNVEDRCNNGTLKPLTPIAIFDEKGRTSKPAIFLECSKKYYIHGVIVAIQDCGQRFQKKEIHDITEILNYYEIGSTATSKNECEPNKFSGFKKENYFYSPIKNEVVLPE